MEKYTVASEEGARFAQSEVGSVVELELSKEQKTALIAAGWLEQKGGKK